MKIARLWIGSAGMAVFLTGPLPAQTRHASPRRVPAATAPEIGPAVSPAIFPIGAPLSAQIPAQPLPGGAQGAMRAGAPPVMEASPSRPSPEPPVDAPWDIQSGGNGAVSARALLNRAGEELAGPGALGGDAAGAALGRLFGETAGPGAAAVPGSDDAPGYPEPINGVYVKRQRQVRALFHSKGIKATTVLLTRESGSTGPHLPRPNMISVRIPAGNSDPLSSIAAAHKILKEGSGNPEGDLSFLNDLVWNIGIEGTAESYTTGIPSPGSPVAADRMEEVVARLPKFVAAYAPVPIAIAPFPGALRRVSLAREKLFSSAWTLHGRPATRADEPGAFYAVWSGRTAPPRGARAAAVEPAASIRNFDRERGQIMTFLSSRGLRVAFVDFVTEDAAAGPLLKRANMLSVRTPSDGTATNSSVKAVHQALEEASRLRRFSGLAKMVWDIGVLGETASFRTAIPAPAERVDPAELETVMAAMPDTVTAYHALPPILAPFPGAFRVAPIAKNKIKPGLWSIHRRPGARRDEAGGYYAVWAAGGIR